MPSASQPDTNSNNRTRTILAELRNELNAARLNIHKAIGVYPSPIPACDAQFNFLLEKRRRLSRALSRVDALLAPDGAEDFPAAQVQAAMDALSDVDETLAARLKNAIKTRRSKIV